MIQNRAPFRTHHANKLPDHLFREYGRMAIPFERTHWAFNHISFHLASGEAYDCESFTVYMYGTYIHNLTSYATVLCANCLGSDC